MAVKRTFFNKHQSFAVISRARGYQGSWKAKEAKNTKIYPYERCRCARFYSILGVIIQKKAHVLGGLKVKTKRKKTIHDITNHLRAPLGALLVKVFSKQEVGAKIKPTSEVGFDLLTNKEKICCLVEWLALPRCLCSYVTDEPGRDNQESVECRDQRLLHIAIIYFIFYLL